MIHVTTYRDLAGSLQLCTNDQHAAAEAFPTGHGVLLTVNEWHSLQQRASAIEQLRADRGGSLRRVVLSDRTS